MQRFAFVLVMMVIGLTACVPEGGRLVVSREVTAVPPTPSFTPSSQPAPPTPTAVPPTGTATVTVTVTPSSTPTQMATPTATVDPWFGFADATPQAVTSGRCL